MASKKVNLVAGVYTRLDTGTDTAIDAQNRSAQSNVKIIFAATIPALDADGDYLLAPSQAIPRNGKTGLMWALPIGPIAADVFITVGE